jgi:hypothetical protein
MASELLTNPRFQNLSKQMVEALNNKQIGSCFQGIRFDVEFSKRCRSRVSSFISKEQISLVWENKKIDRQTNEKHEKS